MSFCNNPRGECQPGPITGNALSGLGEKVCIEVKKVYDAGLLQRPLLDAVTPIAFPGAVPTAPLTFVSAFSSGSKATTSNVQVDRLNASNPRTARVRCTVGFPMTVTYTDASGVIGTATGVMPMSMDAVLCVPEASIIPYEIEAVVSAIASDGTFNGTASVTLTCCVTVILKLVIETELLIPAYGYCRIPPLQEFTSDACSGFFDLPLYP